MSELQPLVSRDLGDLTDLTESMAELGQLQPIAGERDTKEPKTYILAGNRRHASAIALGWDGLLVWEYPALDPDQRNAVQADSDLHTKPLSLFERADRIAKRKPLRKAARKSSGLAATGEGEGDLPLDDNKQRHLRNLIRISKQIPEPIQRKLNGTPCGEKVTYMMALANLHKTAKLQALVVEYLFRTGLVNEDRNIDIAAIATTLDGLVPDVRESLFSSPTLAPDAIFTQGKSGFGTAPEVAQKITTGESGQDKEKPKPPNPADAQVVPGGEKPPSGRETGTDGPPAGEQATGMRSDAPKTGAGPARGVSPGGEETPRRSSGQESQPKGLITIESWLDAMDKLKEENHFLRQAFSGAGAPCEQLSQKIHKAIEGLDRDLKKLENCLPPKEAVPLA
jgi:ParB/RepB/Spo0J family partition protein